MHSNAVAYPPASIASVLTQFGTKMGLGKPVNHDTPCHVAHGLPRITVRQICENMGGTLRIGNSSVRVPAPAEIHAELARMCEVMNGLYALTSRNGGGEVVQVLFGPRQLTVRESADVRAMVKSLTIWSRQVEKAALERVVVEIATEEFLPDPPKSQLGGDTSDGNADTDRTERIRCVGQCMDLGRFEFLKNLVTLERTIQVRALGRSKKNGYWAYIVRTKSGARLALLDTPLKENALYVFDADVEGWETVARQTKQKVRSSGHAAFRERIPHTPTWQKRVCELVEG